MTSVLRVVCRHLIVLYILCVFYYTHRNKLSGFCNPLKFIESKDCALLKGQSLRLLSGKNLDLIALNQTQERIVHYEKDLSISAVMWMFDCGWREYVTYFYCENAGENFYCRHPDAYSIGDGWYFKCVK